MQYLVSLPPNAVPYFCEFANLPRDEWFCASDPPGTKVGSGGGTSWILTEARRASGCELAFSSWLATEKRTLIHGGGQSRRLPAYAALGKPLLPIPILRWARGQRLDQTLLDLQRPLFERIFEAAPVGANTLIASGDALVIGQEAVAPLPPVDVVCFGFSDDPSIASRHGVFVCARRSPDQLEYMLQKPSTTRLREVAADYMLYIDSGIWLLSDRAIGVLMRKCGWDAERERYRDAVPSFYDLYATFGLGLGTRPTSVDPDVSALSVAVAGLPKGRFFHFGTSRELVASCWALQNQVQEQGAFFAPNVKPHPTMFVQNALVRSALTEAQANLWVENACVGPRWKLEGAQVITGVPENDWQVRLPAGICLDMAPIGDEDFAIRPYGLDDSFRGALGDRATQWMNQPLEDWLGARKLAWSTTDLEPDCDVYEAPLFPVMSAPDRIEAMIAWMVTGEGELGDEWKRSKRISAIEIVQSSNAVRLHEQRTRFRSVNWLQLAKNHALSVFFQLDLAHAAAEHVQEDIALPPPLPQEADPLHHAHDRMFRSRVLREREGSGEREKTEAFEILRRSILASISSDKVIPRWNSYEDQIVWVRSPVRIDLAGGWTDTPPHCVLSGGDVVNVAFELNGQPPLQAFARPRSTKSIVLSSIDLGERIEIKSYEELLNHACVGSAFSIPKAALCLAGFAPAYCAVAYRSLKEQLDDFGTGIEISFLAAVPKGSGLGTSSILAATLLGALSDFCGLGWDTHALGNRTVALEQLLTTGGGWQDQYGGIIPGVKLLRTTPGWEQVPRIRWLPESIFTEPEYESAMLLYYTGITRVAKNVLQEIVEGMFLNERDRLSVLREMSRHALETFDTIQHCDFAAFGAKVRRSWELNRRLNADTFTPELGHIIDQVSDLSLGYKLPGAGGGGYLYIVAKDPEAAGRIRRRLEASPSNRRARFVKMSVSRTGLKVSRS